MCLLVTYVEESLEAIEMHGRDSNEGRLLVSRGARLLLLSRLSSRTRLPLPLQTGISRGTRLLLLSGVSRGARLLLLSRLSRRTRLPLLPMSEPFIMFGLVDFNDSTYRLAVSWSGLKQTNEFCINYSTCAGESI